MPISVAKISADPANASGNTASGDSGKLSTAAAASLKISVDEAADCGCRMREVLDS